MSDLILADLLYMTGLGLTMVFLFLKSRLSRRKTALIFAGTALSLMALEVILTYTFSVDLVVRLYSLIVYLPSFLVATLLSRYRGWRLLYQFLSAVLFYGNGRCHAYKLILEPSLVGVSSKSG